METHSKFAVRARSPKPTVSGLDLMWLVGLLEGEGCFTSCQRDNQTHRVALLCLKMTDEDVVSRAAALLGCKVNGPWCPPDPTHKTYWTARVSGEPAAEWMKILLPHMGLRRSEKIRSLLKKFHEPLELRRSELHHLRVRLIQQRADGVRNVDIGAEHGMSAADVANFFSQAKKHGYAIPLSPPWTRPDRVGKRLGEKSKAP